jgi:hypothetical protein
MPTDRRSFMTHALGATLFVQAVSTITRAATPVMASGKSSFIQYKHWSGQHWTATLQDVSKQVGINGLGVTVIDPDFHHVVPAPSTSAHDDTWIEYITWDNSRWHSQCHSHSRFLGVGPISFTFEHFKKRNWHHFDHEDGTIAFIAWDDTKWVASAPPVPGPLTNDSPSEKVFFYLQKRRS